MKMTDLTEIQKKKITMMGIKGGFTLILNLVIYVGLIRYILLNLNDLLSDFDIPLGVVFAEEATLMDLVIGLGILISCFAAVRSASPNDSIMKLVAFLLEIIFTAAFYSIFVLTGNNLLALEVEMGDNTIESNLDIVLNISNIIKMNIGLQFTKIILLILQGTEFLFRFLEKRSIGPKAAQVGGFD